MTTRRGRVRTTIEIDSKGKQELAQVKTGFQGLAGGAQGMVGAFSSIGPVAAAAGAGLGVLMAELRLMSRLATESVRIFHQLGQRGGAFDAVADRFERLAAPGTLNRLQELSGWQLRSQDVMTSWTRVMETGLVSAEEYEEWLTRMTRMAQDRGRDPSQAIEQMTAALRGGGLEALGDYGVNVLEVQGTLREMGLSMESVEGRSRAFDIALEQLRERTGDVDNSASNLADTWGAFSNQWDHWQSQVSRTVSTSPALVGMFEELRQGIFGTGGAAQETGTLIAALAQQIGGLLLTGISGAAQVVQFMMRAQREMAETYESNPLFRWALERLGLGRVGQTSGDIEQAAARVASIAQQARSALLSLPLLSAETGEAGPGESRALGRARAGGRGGATISFEEMLREMRHAAYLQQQEDEEHLVELMGGRGTIQEALNAALETELELHEELARIEQERGDQQIGLVTMMREAQEAYEASEAKAQERFFENLQQASAFASSMGSIFSAIADAEERAGRNADGWRKASGIAMGIKYAIEAGAEYAYAVKEAVSFNVLGAAGHVAAGTMLAVQSGLAFSQLAQSGGGGAAPPKPTLGSYTPATSSATPRAAAAERGGDSYHYYSWGRSPAEFGQIVAEAPWVAEQAGLVPSLPKGLAYE